ncbi:MAG: hypothetical protein ACW96M_05775 [Candidatus Thorarchaeota archaeon]|jgi:hypothetical protein
MTRKRTNPMNNDVFVLERWRSRPEDIEGVLEHPETKELHLIWRGSGTLSDSEIEDKISNYRLWEQHGVDLSVISQLRNLEVLVLEGIHTGHDGHWNYQLDLSPLLDCNKLKHIRIGGLDGGSTFKKLDLSPLASCTALEEIILETLSLRYIDLFPLSQCERLDRIKITNNSILAGIRLPSNPNVREIDLSSNSLITQWMIVGEYGLIVTPRSVPGNHPPKYTTPEVILRPQKHSKMLSQDQLLDLEQLRENKSLEKLNLSSNEISSVRLSFLEERDRLPIIDLRSNPLHFINVRPIVEWIGQLPHPDILFIDDDVKITYSDEYPSQTIVWE